MVVEAGCEIRRSIVFVDRFLVAFDQMVSTVGNDLFDEWLGLLS